MLFQFEDFKAAVSPADSHGELYLVQKCQYLPVELMKTVKRSLAEDPCQRVVKQVTP